MDSEKRKIYNKEYYLKNRDKTLIKAKERVQCECCKRYVSKNRLITHLDTNLCVNEQMKLNKIKSRLSLEKE
jgi:hypothetical protein